MYPGKELVWGCLRPFRLDYAQTQPVSRFEAQAVDDVDVSVSHSSYINVFQTILRVYHFDTGPIFLPPWQS